MQRHDHSHFLIDLLAIKLLAVEDQVARVRCSDFPSDAPRKLCDLIAQSAKQLRLQLPRIKTEEDDAAKRSQARMCLMFAKEMLASVRFAQRARTENTPWSIVPAFEAYVRGLVHEPHFLVLRPKWTHTYEIIAGFTGRCRGVLRAFLDDEEVESVLKDALLNDGHSPEPLPEICVISFPRLERMNPLSHCLFGHEIGHVLCAPWLARSAGIKERIRADLALKVGAEYHDAPESERVEQFDLAVAVCEQGVSELAADLTCALLFGPATLFAIYEYCALMELDELPTAENSYYPPWRYRLRVIQAFLNQGASSECESELQARFPEAHVAMHEWLQVIADLVADECDRHRLLNPPTDSSNTLRTIAMVYSYVEDHMGAIESLVRENVPAAYCYAGRASAVCTVVDRLDRLIPPNEMRKGDNHAPLSIESILNGAWIFKLWRLNSQTAALRFAQERGLAVRLSNDAAQAGAEAHRVGLAVLNRLVVKAIEASFEHHCYLEAHR